MTLTESEALHVYEWEPNALPPESCACMNSREPEEYPTCICGKLGAWVCSHCGHTLNAELLKSCAVCKKGIHQGVKYSQHLHDQCAPDHIKAFFGGPVV